MTKIDVLQECYNRYADAEREKLKVIDDRAKAKVEKEQEKLRILTAQREAKKLAEANSRSKINTVHTVLDYADVFKKGE